MTDVYRIFGSELSPYSVKVRSYLRYKDLPHRWIARTRANADEFAALAKVPIIPLVVSPEGNVMQDSTPIIETLEALHPQPPIRPAEHRLAFIDALLEEFSDEWANKWMFHLRWCRDIDQRSAAGRIALSLDPTLDEAGQSAAAEAIRQRMTGRLGFVGSNQQNATFIERTFRDALAQWDAHLCCREYVLGRRPALADFGLFGQFYQLWSDPTGGALINARAPHALDWLQRMFWPRDNGALESWENLQPTLEPILRDQVGTLFLPWSVANAQAVARNATDFDVVLNGHHWRQSAQKYHSKSLLALRQKLGPAPDRAGIDHILAATHCMEAFHEKR